MTVRKLSAFRPRPQWISSTPMDSTPRSWRCAKPHCTNHSTDRYTASQLVWNARAVSRQLNRRAQRAKNPIMAQVTGRLPSLHGMCSTNQLSNYTERLDRQEHEGRARHTSVIAVLDEAQLVAPDLTAPAIGLPPGGGFGIHHLLDESARLYERVEAVFVAAQHSPFSDFRLAVFVEARVEHDTCAGAQHAIGQVEPLTVILRITVVHDRDVEQRVSAHRGVNRHRDAQLVDLHNAFRQMPESTLGQTGLAPDIHGLGIAIT